MCQTPKKSLKLKLGHTVPNAANLSTVNLHLGTDSLVH